MNYKDEKIKKNVRRYYDSLAGAYYLLRNNWGFEKRKKTIKELCKNFDSKMILDLGTANSEILREVVDDKVGVGIDLSARMLKLGKNNLRKNVILIQADANLIPIKDNSFDLIIPLRQTSMVSVAELYSILWSFSHWSIVVSVRIIG